MILPTKNSQNGIYNVWGRWSDFVGAWHLCEEDTLTYAINIYRSILPVRLVSFLSWFSTYIINIRNKCQGGAIYRFKNCHGGRKFPVAEIPIMLNSSSSREGRAKLMDKNRRQPLPDPSASERRKIINRFYLLLNIKLP